MSLYEGVWTYTMVYECIIKRMDVYEPIRRYMRVYDGIWL